MRKRREKVMRRVIEGDKKRGWKIGSRSDDRQQWDEEEKERQHPVRRLQIIFP